MDAVWQDVRFAWRTLRKKPGFALAAVLTLALGIGANTAIFTVIRSVLLKPLAYQDPGRLMRVAGGVTTVRYREMQAAARSFEELGCYWTITDTVSLSGGVQEPLALHRAHVSTNFLRILGIAPLAGRAFAPEEDASSSAPVAMISAELWRRRFGSDAGIVGRSFALDASPYTIVGVLPDGFAFPSADTDVWVPRPLVGLSPTSPLLAPFGRLKPGVTLEEATAEATVLHHQYASAHPGMLDGRLDRPARVTPLKEDLIANVHSLLWMLFGAVSFVLLIACANVASLLLARAASRTREFALRAALGAGRGRLVRQLLTESAILALAGGVAGLAAARWSLAGITRMSALRLPRMGEIHVDGLVLGFAIALSILTAVVFGLAPSLSGSRTDLVEFLRGSGGTQRRSRVSVRGILVAGQVALSMILLIGAALLMESMVRVSRVSPGFRTDHLLTMQLPISGTRYNTPKKNAAYVGEVIRRVEELPGVESAATFRVLPLAGFPMTPSQRTDQPVLLLSQRPLVAIQEVTPDYFRTMGIGLRRGREVNERDMDSGEVVTVVNEKLARTFWPEYPAGVDPVGQRLLVGASKQPVEIVGIVADAHQSLEADAVATVFRPWGQSPLWGAAFAVRTQGEPMRYANEVRSAIQSVDRDQAVFSVRPMEELVEAAQGQRRVVLLLIGLFAGVAVLLTTVGIYGTISYSVAQRTRELGIRRALGAQTANILRAVMVEGLGIALCGVIVGVAGAYGLTRLMSSLLFQVKATDPFTFVLVASLMSALAIAACCVPARRATRIDPMDALREG